MKLTSLCTSLVGALIALSFNAHAQSLTLSAAFEKALASDPGIQASEQAVQVGREKTIQGQSLFKPQVSLSAGITAMSVHAESALPPGFSALAQPDSSGNIRKTAVQIVQPLINAGAEASRAQLSRQTEAAEVSWTAARQDLMMQVAEAYLAVIASREALRVVDAENTSLEQQRERAQARFDVGMGNLIDLQEARARRDGVQARKVSAQSALVQRAAQFEALTGALANSLAELKPDASLIGIDPDKLEAWQARAMDHNAHILGKKIEVAIAREDMRRYSLRSRPTLDLVGNYALQSKDGDLSLLVSADQQRTATLGLFLNVPLFTGGNLDSREREAQAKGRQSELELAALQRDVRLRVQEAFLAVNTGIARTVALQASERTARTALEATTTGRDIGTRTQLDVLDSQQRLFGSQQDLIQARVDLLVGRLRLAWTVGELDEDALRHIDSELRD